MNVIVRRSRALAGLLMMALGSCAPHYSARYRMIVEVQTPQGVVTGSAVRAVSFGVSVPIPIPLPGEDRAHWSERGEAVAVDLPNGQTLFALIGDPSEDGSMIRDEPVAASSRGLVLWPNTPISPRWRRPYELPLLVRFRNIHQPGTIERVDPNNLVASFGPGYSLRSIAVRKTYSLVTTDNTKKLDWLHSYTQWFNVGGPDFGSDRFAKEEWK